MFTVLKQLPSSQHLKLLVIAVNLVSYLSDLSNPSSGIFHLLISHKQLKIHQGIHEVLISYPNVQCFKHTSLTKHSCPFAAHSPSLERSSWSSSQSLLDFTIRKIYLFLPHSTRDPVNRWYRAGRGALSTAALRQHLGSHTHTHTPLAVSGLCIATQK